MAGEQATIVFFPEGAYGPTNNCAGIGELLGAVDRLLADQALHERLAATARRLRARPGTVRAADLIECLADEHEHARR